MMLFYAIQILLGLFLIVVLFLPNIYERFMGMSKILIPQKMMKEVDVEASFKNLYFDIIGNPVPYLLK